MKKALLSILLVAFCMVGHSQPSITTPVFPSSVSIFDLFEVSFTLGTSYSNPYDPDTILVQGWFYGPDNSMKKVDAFYYEEYTFQKVNGYEVATANPQNNGWRIRFTPTCVGDWYFIIIAEDQAGFIQMPNSGVRKYHFVCTSSVNADGFITKANSKYLKRDIIRSGVRQFHSFFPVGPNIAWYSCNDYGTFAQPKGIYDYEAYIDSLSDRANYMRIWLNRYQYLSLYGPEYTQTDLNGSPVVYFDNTINQKDSAELDHIVTYAKQHGVSIMPCFFTYGDFNSKNLQDPNDPSVWENNPYNTILGLETSCDFFTDIGAKKITKNLIRYIVSRWGYATNIMAWELWNEVSNMFGMCEGYKAIEQVVLSWHNEILYYLSSIDNYDHCVSTSMGNVSSYPYLYSLLFQNFDFVQEHNYQSIQNAESRHQLLYRLYQRTNQGQAQYPTKPFFMGEFGFAQGQNYPAYEVKDPYGIDLHNSSWSSLFFASIGSASFWWWPYVNNSGLYHHYTPLLTFTQNLPVLSDSFSADCTGTEVGHRLEFPNSLQTYYMMNESQDTIFGWSQDTAFAYQSLRWLTDSVHTIQTTWGPLLQFKPNAVFDPMGYVYTLNPAKKPAPSSNSNIITLPITNQPVGKGYIVKWYDSETGLVLNSGSPNYVSVQQDAQGNKYVSFQFPSNVRDLQQHVITNRFGDAVFLLVALNLHPEEAETQ